MKRSNQHTAERRSLPWRSGRAALSARTVTAVAETVADTTETVADTTQPGFRSVWRLAAVTTAGGVLWATRSNEVPMASGLAITVLTAAALTDIEEHRLPDRIVLVAATLLAAGLAVDAVRGSAIRADHIVIGTIALGGPPLLVHIVSPGSMGFGDVKTAAVLGAAVGAVHWQLALSALALAAGGTATVGIVTQRRMIAFGPGLVGAGALALIAHGILLPGEFDSLPKDGHRAEAPMIGTRSQIGVAAFDATPFESRSR